MTAGIFEGQIFDSYVFLPVKAEENAVRTDFDAYEHLGRILLKIEVNAVFIACVTEKVVIAFKLRP